MLHNAGNYRCSRTSCPGRTLALCTCTKFLFLRNSYRCSPFHARTKNISIKNPVRHTSFATLTLSGSDLLKADEIFLLPTNSGSHLPLHQEKSKKICQTISLLKTMSYGSLTNSTSSVPKTMNPWRNGSQRTEGGSPNLPTKTSFESTKTKTACKG